MAVEKPLPNPNAGKPEREVLARMYTNEAPSRQNTPGHTAIPISAPPPYSGRHTPGQQQISAKRPPFNKLASIRQKTPSTSSQLSSALPPLPSLLTNTYEKDDRIHNPGPPAKRIGKARLIPDSTYIRGRGRVFTSCEAFTKLLALLLVGLTTLAVFLAWPLFEFLFVEPPLVLNYRGAGPTVPFIAGGRGLIDQDTPMEDRQKKGANGEDMRLVFSDEFNVEGRTFFPGDDPYWEAMDYHYAATGDLEWYDPAQVFTRDGHLIISIVKAEDPELNHNLDYISGMLQSWNKFCFSGSGLIEVSARFPGKVHLSGDTTFWSAAWLLGNLGRPGYRATTEGMWPYSYDSCDVGTVSNQTLDGVPGNPRGFSYLPGQKLSSCTCPNEDHPGPKLSNGEFLGRGAPEIDLFEIQNDVASQSAQIAPFNRGYAMDGFDGEARGTYAIHDDTTYLNSWKGNRYQQAVSGVAAVDPDNYSDEGGKFDTWAVQFSSSYEDGYITWLKSDKPTWTLYHSALAPDPRVEIGQRLISPEPMSIVLNCAISPSFGTLDIDAVEDALPAEFAIDYVRVYQEVGKDSVGCDNSWAPTSKYIQDHLEAYSNWNHTDWSQANYEFPKNRLKDQC